jgi:hypothetical protein
MNIEKRGDDLYLDGRKIFLLNRRSLWGDTTPEPLTEQTVGTLDKLVGGRAVLGDDVLDHLLRHPRIIPKSWRRSKQGENLMIFFMGTKDPGARRLARGNFFDRIIFAKGKWWRSSYSEFMAIPYNGVRVAALRGENNAMKELRQQCRR